MVWTEIGTATTNSNGVASLPITGTGAGKVKYKASSSDGRIQSEIYEETDCLLKELDSYTLSGESGTTKDYTIGSSTYCFSAPFCLEFDVTAITNPVNLRLRIYEQDNDPVYIRLLSQLGITGACHVKVNVTSTGTEWFVDNVSQYTSTGTAENPFRVGFVIQGGSASLTVQNFKIYSI